MKKKTYRIVWEDDPPRHDAQPSENRAPDAAGGTTRTGSRAATVERHASDVPALRTCPADKTTRGSADKTGSGFVRSETTEQRPSQAIASPTASHPTEPADADRYRTYAPERLMQAGFGSPSPAIPPAMPKDMLRKKASTRPGPLPGDPRSAPSGTTGRQKPTDGTRRGKVSTGNRSAR